MPKTILYTAAWTSWNFWRSVCRFQYIQVILFIVKNMEKVPKYTYLILQPGLPGTFGGPFVDEEIEL